MKETELRLRLRRNLSKAGVTSLIIFSLTACCTKAKLIHVPVNCEGQPDISLGFTLDEVNRFTDDMDLKLSIWATTLRERINTQCRINAEHDNLHKEV